MPLDFNYENKSLEGTYSPRDLLKWIQKLHSYLSEIDCDLDTEISQQLYILAKLAD